LPITRTALRATRREDGGSGPRPTRKRRVRLSASAATALALALTLLSTPASSGPNFSLYLRTRPFVPLFTEANNCFDNAKVNSLGGTTLSSKLSSLAMWYRHVHAEASNQFPLGTACRGSSSSTLASKLSSRGLMVSNYRNGSYISQSEAGMANFSEAASIERTAPLAIATFWPGEYKPSGSGSSSARLRSSLTSSATTVKISAAGSNRPSHTAATWPYLSSRGTGTKSGTYSKNTHDFVAWIRLGSELLKVTQSPSYASGVVTLRVQRGLFGTHATSHPSGDRVFAPVYIGGSAGGFNGSPKLDVTKQPLRYAIKVWKSDGYGWIANRIKQTFGAGMQGYNAVWLDITSCGLSNTVAGPGGAVSMWDDGASSTLTTAKWGKYQEIKVEGLKRLLPGVKLTGNSLDWVTPCNMDLLRGALDGGSFENWLKDDPWTQSMAQSQTVQTGNLPAIYWARWNQSDVDVAKYKRFTYGSLLLTYRTTATRFQYGGPWGLDKPDKLLFWDFGSPTTNPSGVSSLKDAPTGLYVRRFTNGVVVVNPTSSSHTYRLPIGSYDVIHTTTGGLPKAVSSVTVAAHDAAFLLRP
jgi:hypothetical protein